MKDAIFAEVRCIVLYAVRTPIPTTLSSNLFGIALPCTFFPCCTFAVSIQRKLPLMVASVAALPIRRRTLSSVTSQRASARTWNGLYPRAVPVQRILSLSKDPPRWPNLQLLTHGHSLWNTILAQTSRKQLERTARCFNLHPSPRLIFRRCPLSRLRWTLS